MTAAPSAPDPNDMSRHELEAALRALEELERRRSEAPCADYNPHPKQAAFHASQCRRRAIFGANRVGKSLASEQEAMACTYGYRMWEVPDLRPLPSTGDLPPRENIPPEYWVRRSDGVPLRSAPEGMMMTGLTRERGIGQILFPQFLALLPPGAKDPKRGYRAVRGPHGHGSAIYLPNGAIVYFASKEQDANSFEGFILDWCAVDEPIPKRHYSALWTRLTDYSGLLWFTLTPLEPEGGGGNSAKWMYHEFIKGQPDDFAYWTITQDDNPFLTEEMKRTFLHGNYTESELAARTRGTFEFLGSQAIRNFSAAHHIVEPFATPPHWLHGVTADPHHRKPTYFLFWAYDRLNDVLYLINEWPRDDFFKMRDGALTVLEYARLIREIEGRRRCQVRLVDPRFGKAEFTTHGKTNTSWVEAMREHGLEWDAQIPGVTRIETGLEKIRDRLHFDRRHPISPTNQPRLLVFKNVRNAITSLENCCYVERRTDARGISETLDESWKDPLDAIRYTVLKPFPLSDRDFDALQGITERDLQEWQDTL